MRTAFPESASAHKPQKLRLGQKVHARIAHVGSEIGYLDLGGKGEAIIDLRELRNDKGELLVQAEMKWTVGGLLIMSLASWVVVALAVIRVDPMAVAGARILPDPLSSVNTATPERVGELRTAPGERRGVILVVDSPVPLALHHSAGERRIERRPGPDLAGLGEHL